MRLDADVVAWLKASGEGYQTGINAYLRELVRGLRPRRSTKETVEAGRVRQPVAKHDRRKRSHRERANHV